MNAEFVSGIAGVVLSLVFSYVPTVRGWYEGLESQGKSLIMLGLLVVVSGSIFGLSCANVLNYLTCDQAGALQLGQIFLNALVANQGVYLVTRKL